MFPINFEVKRSKVKQTEHLSRNKKIGDLDRYLYDLESPYHTYIDYPGEEDVLY
jgi:hypothetical protein